MCVSECVIRKKTDTPLLFEANETTVVLNYRPKAFHVINKPLWLYYIYSVGEHRGSHTFAFNVTRYTESTWQHALNCPLVLLKLELLS